MQTTHIHIIMQKTILHSYFRAFQKKTKIKKKHYCFFIFTPISFSKFAKNKHFKVFLNFLLQVKNVHIYLNYQCFREKSVVYCNYCLPLISTHSSVKYCNNFLIFSLNVIYLSFFQVSLPQSVR